MKRAALHSLGCKVNSYETEAMQEMLSEQGYEIVAFEEPADVYVINTCSVTSMADRKSRQMLHRARKQNPEAESGSSGDCCRLLCSVRRRSAASGSGSGYTDRK